MEIIEMADAGQAQSGSDGGLLCQDSEPGEVSRLISAPVIFKYALWAEERGGVACENPYDWDLGSRYSRKTND
jgi:hypothetical protein